MIRTFSISNYLSISDKQELSFIAKGPTLGLITKVADGTYLYKLGILFGANASGKSNMLSAINDVFRLLTIPNTDANAKISSYQPFVLKKGEPTQASVSFYANDIRYDYSVSYNETNILEESLYYYPKKTKSLFYTRSYVGDNVQAEIKFGTSLHLQTKTQESIKENTLNNHSVLSVCLKNTFKDDILPFFSLHSYLHEHYHQVDGGVADRGIVEILKEAYANKSKHKFFAQMLNKADLNISDFRPVIIDRPITRSFRDSIQYEDIPVEVKEELLRQTVESVVFENHFNDQVIDIPLKVQSKGTIKYIRILDSLYDLISSSHVYFLDELGEDLHYDLLFYYLSVFLFNSDQSQLLITSQETTLLSQDLVNENRGCVWFVNKDFHGGSSEYSRGDSFGLHKNVSLYNAYHIGKIGGKPYLGSIFLDLEE